MQRDIFLFPLSASCVCLSFSLSVSGDSVPLERPVDVRGNGPGGKEILMYKTPSPCGLSFLRSEFLSCQISTNVECPDGVGRVAGFGKSTDRVDQ